MGEIDLLIEGLAPSADSAQDPADAIPENGGFGVTKPGDWWKLGKQFASGPYGPGDGRKLELEYVRYCRAKRTEFRGWR
jgi:hypothetical protein